jgi:K+-sensing histidine kinase KdpD
VVRRLRSDPREAPDKLSATAQRQIFENLQFAKELGAEGVKLNGKDIVRELIRLAREHNVTYVILGRSQRSRGKSSGVAAS